MLEFEVQQYMPIEMSDYIVQSKIIETFEEDNITKTRLLAAAMPKEIARSYYDLLQAIGLNGHILDIQSNAIDKLFQSGFTINNDSDFNNQSVAVIDFGYSHINVVMFDRGQYKFNRLITQGADAIDHNLMSFMDYTKREAEEKKLDLVDLAEIFNPDDTTMPLIDEETLRVRNIVKNVVDTWINEIERIFKFHTTRSAGNTIDKVYIYGGSSNMEGFEKYLQDAIGIPTKRIQQIANVAVQNSTSKTLTPYVNALGSMIRR
jgi:type IV pilus assembly protein PilM